MRWISDQYLIVIILQLMIRSSVFNINNIADHDLPS